MPKVRCGRARSWGSAQERGHHKPGAWRNVWWQSGAERASMDIQAGLPDGCMPRPAPRVRAKTLPAGKEDGQCGEQ